ncbi:MAG: GH32 C-terminal domain-containing protein, partial [Clostridia bacterium]|nr:GH32 C-terminal domain-containing protein [Clostridia bacterium]
MKKRITSLILSMTMLLGIVQFVSFGSFGSFGDENNWETNLTDLASTTNKPVKLTYVDGGININYTTSNDALAISKTKTNGNFIFESDVTFTKGNVANLIFGASKNTTSEDSFIFKLDRTNKGETKVFCFSSSKGYPTISTNNGNSFEYNKASYKMRVMVIDGLCTVYVDGIPVCSATLPSYYADGYLGIGTAEYSSATFQNTVYTDLGDKKVAKITDIEVEGMALSPAFSEKVGAYTLPTLPNETKTIKITVSAEGSAELKINGKTVQIGAPTEVSVSVGKNTVSIVLKDEATGVEIPVTVTVSRQPSALEFKTEDYRGQYHFSCAEGWLNDPNGLIYLNGRWHLFFQHIPYSTDHNGSEMHWGHAVSDDLVHWEELPVAIAPDDQIGAIWSGSAVADPENVSGLFAEKSKDNLIAYFTNVKGSQDQSLAYSSDGGITWTKYAKNPIIKNSDDPLNDSAFRDPNVFWCEQLNTYLMVIAGGPLRIYSSKNLIDWKFESGYDSNHPEYRPSGIGAINSECPDLFPISVEGDPENVKWIYTGAGAWYMIGELEVVDGRICYIPDSNTHYPLEFGNDSYAGVTFKNAPGGRVVMIGWMNTWSYAESIPTSPWNGTLTLCYELTLKSTSKGLRIFMNPVEEYNSLRGTPLIDVKDAIIKENGENILEGCRGDQYELIAHLDPDESVTEVGFRLFKGNNYEMLVKYNPKTKLLTMNRGKVSDVKPGDYANNLACQYTVTENADSSIDLRIFVDWGSIEVIVGEGEIYGSQLLLPDFASIGMEAYSVGGDTVADVTIYPLDTVWRENESTEINEVALDIKDGSQILAGTEFTVYSRVNSRFADQRVTWTLVDPEGAVQIVSENEYSITLKAVKCGEFSLTAVTHDGSREVTSSVAVVDELTVVNNKITIQPKYGAWENWGNSPNKGDLDAAAQLLVGIKLNGEKVDISTALTWKITIVGGSQNKTITMSPSTKALEYDLYRFETCLGKGDNQFIPVKGVEYTVTIKIYDGEALVYYSDPTSGFTCPMDPIYPGYSAPTTIDNEVSVGAWYSKIENWNGKTYFLTGLTSSSNALLYDKLVNKEWQIKLIVADETASKTYTIEQ